MAKEAQSPKLRQNEINALARKPGESTASVWVKGPGLLSATTLTHKQLIGVARARGLNVTRVSFVRVANLEGEMRIWLYPVDESDPQRLPLQNSSSKFFVNLSQPLLDWNMTLPTGQRNRYDIRTDEKNQSPVGPALCFDLDKPLEVKHDRPPQGGTAGSPPTEPASSST